MLEEADEKNKKNKTSAAKQWEGKNKRRKKMKGTRKNKTSAKLMIVKKIFM